MYKQAIKAVKVQAFWVCATDIYDSVPLYILCIMYTDTRVHVRKEALNPHENSDSPLQPTHPLSDLDTYRCRLIRAWLRGNDTVSIEAHQSKFRIKDLYFL